MDCHPVTSLLAGIGLFLLIQLGIAISNRRRVAWTAPVNLRHPLPLVSILVPARNEEADIEPCLRSLLAQDYPQFELLVLDDLSTDRTFEIATGLAADNPRLAVIQGAPLPSGWLGKNWACAQLAARANGQLLLFTDADTRHRADSVHAAVAALQHTGADLLALWPRLPADGLGEQLVVPLIPWSVFSILSIPLAQRLRAAALSAGIGQFLLFRRSAYRAIGGHRAVRAHAAEDLALVRRVKRAGLRWRLLDGQRLVESRMYTGLRAAWAGLSKNLYPAFEYRALPLLLAWGWLNLTASLPLLTLAAALLGRADSVPPTALALSAAAVLAELLLWTLVLRWFGYSARLALLYPALLAIGLALAVSSIWSTRTGRAQWKGRPLSLPTGPQVDSP